MQNTPGLAITPPSLPDSSGTVRGMGETLANGGPDGIASLTLPLPVSLGRGVAPDIALSYSSGAGNGPFGMGWQGMPVGISLRTAHGVPRYAGDDTFLAPDGEVLQPTVTDCGAADVRSATTLCGAALGESWQVSRYLPRVVQAFTRTEYWQPPSGSTSRPFWVRYTPDGQVHIYGKNAQARISNPADEAQIAQWLPEESITPTGEHIYYLYRAEDDQGGDDTEKQQHPQTTAQRYPDRVLYGNITPQTTPFCVATPQPDESQWLFSLLFDYGERSSSLNDTPAYAPGAGQWIVRPDCFSRYEYGFELRTRRLCQQVLMFHRLKALAGQNDVKEVPALVSRLILSYDLNNCISTLVAARQVAHETDGTPVTLAPLEFDYQRQDLTLLSDWQSMPQLGNLNSMQPWQLVDLYGEGIPGVLYQDSGAWWYREPERDTSSSDTDAVRWTALSALPRIPAQQRQATLLDINGDGKLDWLVTAYGVNGYHSMVPDRIWSPFIPVSALPVEYFHPQSKVVDINSSGLPDVVLVGPRSVRVYASNQQGWDKGISMLQANGVTLPLPGRDARRLVGFADMAGSGQQHLVEISQDTVRYWPNLGHGCFGLPVLMSGFAPTVDTPFNPDRVFLMDVDGSGTTDILYLHRDSIELFINQSGNRFSAAQSVALPSGVYFDNTCQLQAADIQGLGVASLILTLPHMPVSHWRLDLATAKPWLLNAVNNNMGADTSLFYRSSAQFWLDEKQQVVAAGGKPVSYLPFPVQLLWRSETLDEITGNRLTSALTYRHGVWDGREREFRGFGCVTVVDTDDQAKGSGTSATLSLPARRVNWYATGLDTVDALLPAEYWQADNQAFPGYTPRYTTFDTDKQDDVAFTPSDEECYWLNRAMKGQRLRSELYGDDGSAQAAIPYVVTESRGQGRLLPGADKTAPSVLSSMLESREYHYERITGDPQCQQSIVLKSDRWGYPLETVAIHYPRRSKPEQSPYPDDLPDTLVASSYDDQQGLLRLSRQRLSYFHLTDGDSFVTGLADSARRDEVTAGASKVPAKGLSKDDFSEGATWFTSATYAGHQRTVWTGDGGKPVMPPLVAWTESAEFDAQALKAFDGIFSADALQAHLTTGGYTQATVPFAGQGEAKAWIACRGYTDYGKAEAFYRPQASRSTLLTGKTTASWDTHYCVVQETADAAGLSVKADYDYRFLLPVKITDVNDNVQQAELDALGRIRCTRVWGKEAGQPVGYSDPDSKPFVVPSSVDDGLALKTGIPVATLAVTETLSWMPVSNDMALQQASVLTEDNRIGALAWRRYQQRQGSQTEIPGSDRRLPPHTLRVTTDRYDNDPAQQLRQLIAFSDGFNRLLQTAIRFEAGDAWQRAEDGSLVTDSSGRPEVAATDTRWAVSGRTEYDGKSQVIRQYQPFFLNSWQYVSDDSARQDLYADTHSYDPPGREVKVHTAKGYLRRTRVMPWFTVSEDENDTLTD